MPLRIFLFCFIFSFWTSSVEARETGHSAAMKYFTDKKSSTKRKNGKKSVSASRQSLLALSLGSLTNNKVYGQFHPRPLWNAEIFYQSHRGSYIANAFYLEWQQFPEDGNRFDKLGLLFGLSFPRSIKFPVYIGIAAGPGFLMKPGNKKFKWTMDSRAYLGLRLTGTSVQYFLQTGFKNHLLEFRESRIPGWFISLGLGYRF